MARVVTEFLGKSFGEVRAVDEVSLALRDGELLVLLGPSGCGKTTLLRLIAGLDTPDQGQVRIGEEIVTHVEPGQRRVAMVFQNYALYPHMDVRRNIGFPLRNEHLPRAVIEARVRRAARLFDIERLLERRPRQLSGGERQRVALARALVREPQAFLLDEPLSSLDAALRRSARAGLKRYQRRLGITTLLVTHDQQDAMSLGDRIAIMVEGRIRQVGQPQTLYHRPADTFVASFLGAPPMNLVEMDSCILGFHPEDFSPLAAERHVPAQSLVLPFHIRRIEEPGGRQLVYGEVDGLRGRVAVVASLRGHTGLAPDTTVDFAIGRERLTWFNRHTQLRMEATAFTHAGRSFA